MVLTFLDITGYCQEKCGVILDASTYQPIPYATIHYRATPQGMYASDKGTFCLARPAGKVDSVLISTLGYAPSTLALSDFLKKDTIYLKAVAIPLREVVVRSDNRTLQSRLIGYSKKPLLELQSLGFAHNSNATLATYIPNELRQTSVINRVYCRLTPKKNDLVKSFRVALRLYSHDRVKQLPGQDLLPELVIADVPFDGKEIEFDVANFGLAVPADGFWIGVSCVGYTDKQGHYKQNQDREFGKFTLKGTKRLKINTVEHIAPMYNFTKATDALLHSSVSSNWSGKWLPRTERPNMAFCFGAEVVW